MTTIQNAAPIQPPTPAPTVPECWVVLYHEPDGTPVSESWSATPSRDAKLTRARVMQAADECPGAVVLHYVPGTPVPSQDLIDLHDYIGCFRQGVKPDDSLRDRVAAVLARAAAGKAGGQ